MKFSYFTTTSSGFVEALLVIYSATWLIFNNITQSFFPLPFQIIYLISLQSHQQNDSWWSCSNYFHSQESTQQSPPRGGWR